MELDRYFAWVLWQFRLLFWWQPVLFFQEESQLLSLQRYENQSCHRWLPQEMSGYLKLPYFCIVYEIVCLQQVHHLPCHHHHFVHPQMSRLHLCSSKFYHFVFHAKSCAVHYHQLLVWKRFHQNHFLHQNCFCKIQLHLLKEFFFTFLFHYLSCNLKWKTRVTEKQTQTPEMLLQCYLYCNIMFSYCRIQNKFSIWLNTGKQWMIINNHKSSQALSYSACHSPW